LPERNSEERTSAEYISHILDITRKPDTGADRDITEIETVNASGNVQNCIRTMLNQDRIYVLSETADGVEIWSVGRSAVVEEKALLGHMRRGGVAPGVYSVGDYNSRAGWVITSADKLELITGDTGK